MSADLGYYRFPTIQGDSVVFVCEDDLWTISIGGGTAWRLSANPSASSHPVLSPDGRWLAFTGRDEGPPEVWVMPAQGGPPVRRTFLGSFTNVVGWTRDSSAIIFASDYGQPFAGYHHLYEVPVKEGAPRQLPYGPAMSVSYAPGGGGVVLGRNTGDPARWKRYRGGTAGTLWIDPKGSGEFRKLVDPRGNLVRPMWIGKRIYFLSDHEGVGNLYSCLPSGKDLQRHTHHGDYYVRFPNTDERRIAYCAGADIYVYDTSTGEEQRVDVQLRSARPQRNRRFVPAARYMESYDVHPEGHSLGLIVRGKPFTFPFWEDAVAQHGEPDGVRYRLARWMPDGKRIVAVADAHGEEELVLLSPGGSQRRITLDTDIGRAIDLVVSPTKPDRVALSNHRYELYVADLGQKKAHLVDRNRFFPIHGVDWSPDGRWLAYGLPESFTTIGLKAYDVQKRTTHRLTRPDFKDVCPCFDPSGKYIYFISYREYDPVYDSQIFDLGFPRGARILALPLTPDLPSPFEPKPRPPIPGTSANGNGGQDGKKSKKPSAVRIDWSDIEDRPIALPISEGDYGQVAVIDEKVLYSTFPIEGSLNIRWWGGDVPARGTLKAYDLAEQHEETLIEGITDFTISANRRVLVYRAGSRLRALPAGQRPKPEAAAKGPGRESGWIDLSRVKVSVHPGAEWKQMFREAWRLMRDHFWVPDMSGVDWAKVYERYDCLLDRVGSRSEFSDLMWEMQGELGTSHAYELGGDYRPQPVYHMGFLGADLAYHKGSDSWRIERIPRGDGWRKPFAAPLAAPGVNVHAGDRVLAVGNRKVNGRYPPGEGLVNLAGQKVDLLIAGKNGKGKRRVTIRTLHNEQALRYRDWVEHNRRRVVEETKGRVGYIHIPDMGPFGFAEFHRYFLAEFVREGLVIDVRFNRGGHVSQLLLEKLLRRRVGYDIQRWGDPMPYPMQSPAGPMVALTNERAGSDGDIFSHCFKLYGLGPLIGKRTWGGVIGIWPRHALVDGSLTTQPEYSFWFEDVGFGVENYGAEPDMEVEILPQDHAAGRDPQLDRGIAEVLNLLRRKPARMPDFSVRPRLGLPRLPKVGS